MTCILFILFYFILYLGWCTQEGRGSCKWYKMHIDNCGYSYWWTSTCIRPKKGFFLFFRNWVIHPASVFFHICHDMCDFWSCFFQFPVKKQIIMLICRYHVYGNEKQGYFLSLRVSLCISCFKLKVIFMLGYTKTNIIMGSVSWQLLQRLVLTHIGSFRCLWLWYRVRQLQVCVTIANVRDSTIKRFFFIYLNLYFSKQACTYISIRHTQITHRHIH